MLKKDLRNILFLIFLVIFFETLNVNYSIKVNSYVSINLISYLSLISVYIIMAIYSYIFFDKILINKTYKYLLSLLIIGNLLIKIFMYKSTYVFSYLSIVARILLLIYILNLKEERK